MPKKKTAATKQKKLPRIKPINNFALLMVLSVFQLLSGTGTFEVKVLLCTLALIVLEWLYVSVFYFAMHRRNFELEFIAFFLSGVGITVIGSIKPDDAFKQLLMLIAGVIGFIVLVFLMGDVDLCMRLRLPVAVAAILLLIVNIAIAKVPHGARNWITIFGVTFQPSEFVKLTFVLFTASMFYQSTELKQVCITTAAAAAHVLILVLSKDLGGALILFVSYVLMLFIATGKKLYLFGGIGLGCGAAAAAFGLFDHVKRRVAAWKNPWADIDNTGYQITQSLFAIGTGGWFGMGLCQGMPGKIPVVEKDFIFAAIGEEFGGIFAVCLLLICLGCFIQFMMIASQMQAMFYKLIAFGLGTTYIVQVFLTIGGVTKFIPSTGVTLPFVSYGGSSILSTFIVFNVVQGLYILKRNEEEEDYDEEE